jgi:hypothetical protein
VGQRSTKERTMSDAAPPYRPFAHAYGIFIGIVILWASSLGLFWLGKVLIQHWVMGSEGGEGG